MSIHTHRQDEPQCTERGKSGHTHTITALDLYALACFVQTIFVQGNSFQRPRDSQSPAEKRAVMATEENSSCSMRACLLGQTAPEQRIEMQQKSGLKELVTSVCPITTRKLTKDLKIMNRSSPTLPCRR